MVWFWKSIGASDRPPLHTRRSILHCTQNSKRLSQFASKTCRLQLTREGRQEIFSRINWTLQVCVVSQSQECFRSAEKPTPNENTHLTCHDRIQPRHSNPPSATCQFSTKSQVFCDSQVAIFVTQRKHNYFAIFASDYSTPPSVASQRNREYHSL